MRFPFSKSMALVAVFWLGLAAACTPAAEPGQPALSLQVESWPETSGGMSIDATIEARIDSLMAIMTVEEMVAQTIQGDINSITPGDVREYRLGSVLNGGNSAPRADVRAPAPEWLVLADVFYEASTDTSGGGAAIPLLWGTDSVHGHNNVIGATVFPHNIGLGAARNPDLIREIGAVTALETVVTGQDWTFAPTLAVAQDDRWGRTYESYSEDPAIVAEYARAMVEGIQGALGSETLFASDKVIATAKHYLGDGGTDAGKDQGDNLASEADLRDIHGAGYPPAVEAGVQVVMASFSSWRGEKLHGSTYLLTDVLKDRMGFNGFVVGDWNGHGQVPGCQTTDCAASLNAGVDMFMAPDSWKGLYENTLAQVKAGEISQERLQDAVRRILRVKFRVGLFEKEKPSSRPLAGSFELLGSAEHRAVARQAVRESLVLLKNQGGLLPLRADSRILVAGDGADDIGKQSGGWTLSWQGTGNSKADFPNGESIWDGIKAASDVAGGQAVLSLDGTYDQRPDVAIVVFGENPYAEFQGDIPDLDYQPGSATDLALLQSFKAAGVPTVAVFLSGRPLWVNPEINASDAFVAAWLPGSEGSGVADVLLRKPDGSIHHDFKGKLSFSWPKTAAQTPLNHQDESYDPLFPFGYGLTYADEGNLPMLAEESGIAGASGGSGVFFADGQIPQPWTLQGAAAGETVTVENALTTVGEALTIRAVDRYAQEDARQAAWSGAAEATLSITGEATDFTRESNGDMAVSVEYRVDAAPEGPVFFVVECGEGCGAGRDVTSFFAEATPGEWMRLDIKLSCFATEGADMARLTSPFGIKTAAPFTARFASIRLVSNEGQAVCPGE